MYRSQDSRELKIYRVYHSLFPYILRAYDRNSKAFDFVPMLMHDHHFFMFTLNNSKHFHFIRIFVFC